MIATSFNWLISYFCKGVRGAFLGASSDRSQLDKGFKGIRFSRRVVRIFCFFLSSPALFSRPATLVGPSFLFSTEGDFGFEGTEDGGVPPPHPPIKKRKTIDKVIHQIPILFLSGFGDSFILCFLWSGFLFTFLFLAFLFYKSVSIDHTGCPHQNFVFTLSLTSL